MGCCYRICNNYGIAILLLTFLSKIVLLPLSIWVQKNSIKMVRMQPEINFMKAVYFGDPDRVAEEQARIFKKEKYNPFASIIPLAVQLLLLAGIVNVVKANMTNPHIEMGFFGLQLGQVPAVQGGSLLLSPVAAGVSAWILCMAQNASNVLQSEQPKWSQYGMLLFSVALSVYLGLFVPAGVALYWTASNLMAVAQLYFLNWLINPKDFIDYEKLEQSRDGLKRLEKIGGKKRLGDTGSRREKADYKRFFSVENKRLVFYSESSGFYKYYRGIIEYLLAHTDLTIHYITSDPEDAVFQLAKTQGRIKPYYIAEKRLITLMMKIEADMVVMTMPDLETYHIKRSYVRKDIEYLYVQHGMGSVNLTFRKGALDHFDSVLCVGKHQKEEVEKTENAYGLAKKRLVECGYPLLDEMRRKYGQDKKRGYEKKTVLIAPSWQDGNIVESCLEELLGHFTGSGYRVTVRPHPQHVRHYPEEMSRLEKKYRAVPDIEVQVDFSSDRTVFEAGLLVTDWSDIAYEYAFTTRRPVLFINTPVKAMNPEYQKIGVEPFNIWVREEIGKVLEPCGVAHVVSTADQMLASMDAYAERIESIVQEYVYHPGTSAQVAAEYIVGRLQEKAAERKKG